MVVTPRTMRRKSWRMRAAEADEVGESFIVLRKVEKLSRGTRAGSGVEVWWSNVVASVWWSVARSQMIVREAGARRSQ